MPWNLKRPFLETSPRLRRGDGKHDCCQKSDKEEQPKREHVVLMLTGSRAMETCRQKKKEEYKKEQWGKFQQGGGTVTKVRRQNTILGGKLEKELKTTKATPPPRKRTECRLGLMGNSTTGNECARRRLLRKNDYTINTVGSVKLEPDETQNVIRRQRIRTYLKALSLYSRPHSASTRRHPRRCVCCIVGGPTRVGPSESQAQNRIFSQSQRANCRSGLDRLHVGSIIGRDGADFRRRAID